MLLFAHTGITLGAGMLLSNLTAGHFTRVVTQPLQSPLASQESDRHEGNGTPWGESISRYVDLRLLLIGSLLPDIIDKPIGQFFFRGTFSNGRIFSHSLLFLIIINLIGFYLYRNRRKTWLLVFSFGTFMHLVLDQMWRNLHTLLWPVYGFTFEKGDISDWILGLIHSLRTDPIVYIPELLGLAILVWFIWSLIRRRQVFSFLRFGRAY